MFESIKFQPIKHFHRRLKNYLVNAHNEEKKQENASSHSAVICASVIHLMARKCRNKCCNLIHLPLDSR